MYRLLLGVAFLVLIIDMAVITANPTRFNRWIQSTGFGSPPSDQFKRAIDAKTQEQQGGLGNGIFPGETETEEGNEFENEATGGQGQEGQGQEGQGQEGQGQEGQGQEGQGQTQKETGGIISERLEPTGQQGQGQGQGQGQEVDTDDDDQPLRPKYGKYPDGFQGSNDFGVFYPISSTHKPWYKKVHGFLKGHYDSLKSRFSRNSDDYYVTQ